jgi:uncharacterized protein with NRDE domain
MFGSIYYIHKMCTVSYVPLQKGFVLTSNRDEHVHRAKALLPKKYPINGEAVGYPLDPKGKGSWIVSSRNYTLSLLNGGLEAHVPARRYKKSRGLVLLDFFEYGHIDQFINHYNFSGLEPFTLLILRHNALKINKLVWDGRQLYVKKINPKIAQILSSTQLYSPEIIKKREQGFDAYLGQLSERSPEAILELHESGIDLDSENNFVMKRPNGVQTVSITQVIYDQNETMLSYKPISETNVWSITF